jgi:TldD protein
MSTPSRRSAASSPRASSYFVHPDGTRKLVRGAVLDELDNRILRSGIIAAGDDEHVANSLGAIPTTTIAPSLLFDDIGIKHATEDQQKLPCYPPPSHQASFFNASPTRGDL